MTENPQDRITKVADAYSANGLTGMLLRSFNGRYFLRVSGEPSNRESPGFTDYWLAHTDLEVKILSDDAYLYLIDGDPFQGSLDHSPATRGLSAQLQDGDETRVGLPLKVTLPTTPERDEGELAVKAMKGKHAAQFQRSLESMAAEGRLPCPQGHRYLMGTPSFSISVRIHAPGTVGVDIRYHNEEEPAHYLWGAQRPEWDQLIDANALLTAIAEAWHVISRPFRRGKPPYLSGPTETADLSNLIAPSLRFIAEDRTVIIESAHGRYCSGAECLIVAECFMALADQLAAWLPVSPAAGQWFAVRDFADIYPWRIETSENLLLPDQADRNGEAAFYASKIGFDLATWPQLAVAWETDPRRDEEAKPFPDLSVPLPSDEELAYRLAKGAWIRSMPLEEYRHQALSLFLSACRAEHYYRQWDRGC